MLDTKFCQTSFKYSSIINTTLNIADLLTDLINILTVTMQPQTRTYMLIAFILPFLFVLAQSSFQMLSGRVEWVRMGAMAIGASEMYMDYVGKDDSEKYLEKMFMSMLLFVAEDLPQLYLMIFLITIKIGQTVTGMQIISPCITIISTIMFRSAGFTRIKDMHK